MLVDGRLIFKKSDLSEIISFQLPPTTIKFDELLKMKTTQTFAVLQRLLCQSAENAGQARQRKLLVAAPRLGKHVRERLLSPSAEALQDPQDGEGSVRRIAQVKEGPVKEQPQLLVLLPPPLYQRRRRHEEAEHKVGRSVRRGVAAVERTRRCRRSRGRKRRGTGGGGIGTDQSRETRLQVQHWGRDEVWGRPE